MAYTSGVIILQLSDRVYQHCATTMPNTDIYDMCDALNLQMGSKACLTVFGFEDEPDHIGVLIEDNIETVIDRALLARAQQRVKDINHPLTNDAVLCVVPQFH